MDGWNSGLSLTATGRAFRYIHPPAHRIRRYLETATEKIWSRPDGYENQVIAERLRRYVG